MKKKLSFALALAMVVSLTACGNTAEPAAEEGTAAETTAAAQETAAEVTEAAAETTETTPAPVEAEPIDAEPLVYLGFENADGLKAVEQSEDIGSLTGANFGIVESAHPILIAEGQGAVGNALYLDGKYGVDFDMKQTDESYTFSFWYNADRVSIYGPVVQIGRNIGMANTDAAVTWLNVTKTDWGTNSADIFPVVWNRNSSIGTEVTADGVWPWIYAMDDTEHGKREWCLVTVVADGNRYVADDGMERVGTKFYLDGELKWEANAENMYYQGLSPEILTGDGLEGHIGINYWDTVFKGFIDELYIYDEALTDGQVKTLFDQGNPPAEPVAPEASAAEAEAEPEALPAAPVDESAIDVLGTPDRELGFWSDTTAGYELADGGKLNLKLNNYSNGEANYKNFVLALTNTAVTTDKVASADNFEGYMEYAVIRADAYGWPRVEDGASEETAPELSFETSWTDWTEWLKLMTNAVVTVNMERSGDAITVNYTFEDIATGATMTETANVKIKIADTTAPVYVHVTGEGAYIELLSVE